MPILAGIPIIALAAIVQSAVVSQISLLEGTADLVLLVLLSWTLQEQVEATWEWALLAGFAVGVLSATPLWLPIVAYLLITAIGTFFRRRVWQVPLLVLFTTTFISTILYHALTAGYLLVAGVMLDLGEAFNLIILPSVLLNLLVAIPVYGFIGELARLLYPEEIDA
jgi:rod shape-determining protein MreD